MTRLAILVPVLDRPHRVRPLLDSIQAATPGQPDVLFVCDPGDRATQDQVALAGARLISPGGSYAHKINEGVRATTAPLLFLAADDLHFHPGWLPAAEARLRDGAQVVGVNDLCSRRVQAGEHATHFLMTREYALQPAIDGTRGPLAEAYTHSYVDDELVATARVRGVLAFATDSIVEHLHPDAGKAEWDDVYQRGRGTIKADCRLFRRREHLWT